ncbi:glycine cleavage system protein R [Verrucomicrobiota bacterium]
MAGKGDNDGGGTGRTRYVMSVLVTDRVGILRDITSAVADMGGNIDGISQTVVEGYFTVILMASFDRPFTEEEVESNLLANFSPGEAAMVIRPYDSPPAPPRPANGDRYVVTITGLDRPGILKAVTAFLAEKGINIEDWHVTFSDPGITHVGEVTIPRILDIKQVQDEFQQVLSPMQLVSCIQHENIFRATNEVGPIKPLLGDTARA